MKMSKVIIPLLATTGTALLVGYALKKARFPESSKVASDIAQVVSNATINAEKSFGLLSQSQINEIASNTPRGVKAVIDGDTLAFWFRSASGKKDATATFELDSEGNILCTFLPYSGTAHSPRFFIENLKKAMKAKTLV